MGAAIVALSLPSTEALSFGSSKLFQIVVPLATFVVLRETPGLKNLIPKAAKTLSALGYEIDEERLNSIFSILVGFSAWKIGCDFGFLIVNTGAAPWSIAFTWIGLIPYAAIMYVVYYLIGQKMIIQGQLNPFKEEYVAPRLKGRPSFWRQLLSKFFHESMNVTSSSVPLRQVTIKPFIDYGAIIVSWPAYNVALLFSQSGEINFDPFVQFFFLSILVFYIVNVFGYILGYNLGEFFYFRLQFLIESLKTAGREFDRYQQICRLWSIFDADGDGSISPKEFRQALRTLGQDPSRAELRSLLQTIDLDRSRSIDFEEFESALTSGQDARRVKLLLDKATLTNADGNILRQILARLILQWQVIRNNTRYIQIQGFLQRYGLNNRWLLSGSLGIIFIIWSEPTVASALFSWSDRLQHAWFYHFGHLDEIHLVQVLTPSSPTELLEPQGLASAFEQRSPGFQVYLSEALNMEE